MQLLHNSSSFTGTRRGSWRVVLPGEKDPWNLMRIMPPQGSVALLLTPPGAS